MFCETSSFYCTVHKMCFFSPLFFFTAYGFSFHNRRVSVHVLRTMFVPGWGGPFEFINFMSFLCFLSTDTHLPVIPSQIYFFPAHSFIVFFPFLFSSSLLLPDFHPFSRCFFCIYSFFLFPCPCLKGPLGALWFVCWKAYQHHRRHHWNLALFSLARSLFLSLPFIYFFFLHLFLMWKF